MPPVSAISDEVMGGFEKLSGKAGGGGMGDKARADGTVAGHEVQGGGGYPGLVQDADGLEGDERRLLGRLGDDGVAGCERGADLAQEDRQGKSPRTDADEHPAAAVKQAVVLPGGTGQDLPLAEQAAGLDGVVAQEVDGFAQLRHAVVERFSRLGLHQCNQSTASRLKQVRGAEKGG